jgi:hypothetical protein
MLTIGALPASTEELPTPREKRTNKKRGYIHGAMESVNSLSSLTFSPSTPAQPPNRKRKSVQHEATAEELSRLKLKSVLILMYKGEMNLNDAYSKVHDLYSKAALSAYLNLIPIGLECDEAKSLRLVREINKIAKVSQRYCYTDNEYRAALFECERGAMTQDHASALFGPQPRTIRTGLSKLREANGVAERWSSDAALREAVARMEVPKSGPQSVCSLQEHALFMDKAALMGDYPNNPNN